MTILALLYVATSLNDGNVAYREAKYDEAIAAYKRTLAETGDKPEVLFNLGDALYRRKKYAQAQSAWDRAARATQEPGMMARARYNQGNASYRQAGEIFKTHPQAALVLLQRAANAYSAVLKSNPDFRQAQYNLDATRDFARLLGTQRAPNASPDSSPESPEQVLASEQSIAKIGVSKRRSADRDW